MDNPEILVKSFDRPDKKKIFFSYLPFLLFFATLITTLFAGALMQYISPQQMLRNPVLILKGAQFAIPLMIILLTHEMGHYLTSRVHRVNSSLPYFIPFPNYIGTFGAVIKMKSPMQDSKSLLDIGAAGPLAGFVLSVIASAYGLAHATAIPISAIPPDTFWTPRIAFGPNIAFLTLLKWFGPAAAYKSGSVIVNPIMDAGWLGMFVTSLNLIPAGQLDGGHIAYALFGAKRARGLAKIVVGGLIFLGLMGLAPIFLPADNVVVDVWFGYIVWAILIIVIGIGHPPPLNPYTKLDAGRKLIGLVCLLIWIITFTPVPFGVF